MNNYELYLLAIMSNTDLKAANLDFRIDYNPEGQVFIQDTKGQTLKHLPQPAKSTASILSGHSLKKTKSRLTESK